MNTSHLLPLARAALALTIHAAFGCAMAGLRSSSAPALTPAPAVTSETQIAEVEHEPFLHDTEGFGVTLTPVVDRTTRPTRPPVRPGGRPTPGHPPANGVQVAPNAPPAPAAPPSPCAAVLAFARGCYAVSTPEVSCTEAYLYGLHVAQERGEDDSGQESLGNACRSVCEQRRQGSTWPALYQLYSSRCERGQARSTPTTW